MQYKGAVIVPLSEPNAEQVAEQIKRNMAERFDGYSAYTGHGGWVMDNGNTVEEDHVRIEAAGSVGKNFTGEFFRKQAQYAKNALDEEAVMVEIYETDVEFI